MYDGVRCTIKIPLINKEKCMEQSEENLNVDKGTITNVRKTIYGYLSNVTDLVISSVNV